MSNMQHIGHIRMDPRIVRRSVPSCQVGAVGRSSSRGKLAEKQHPPARYPIIRKSSKVEVKIETGCWDGRNAEEAQIRNRGLLGQRVCSWRLR